VDTDTGGWGDTIEGFVHPDFVRSDPDNPDVTTTFRVRYEWSGFGLVRSADSNSFEAEIFRNQPYELDWGIMDFTGHRVLLRDGQGAGQMANITDMDITVSGGVITSVSFDIDCAFNGYSVSSWGLIPGLNAATNERTYFEIDGGKNLAASPPNGYSTPVSIQRTPITGRKRTSPRFSGRSLCLFR
jgi:hypothetical protein